jgi:hypothetical protein
MVGTRTPVYMDSNSADIFLNRAIEIIDEQKRNGPKVA